MTTADWHFNNTVLKSKLNLYKGETEDEIFTSIWQGWVDLRSSKYGSYFDDWKKEDLDVLFKITKGDRDLAFDVLVYLNQSVNAPRITRSVLKEYLDGRPYEWE